MLGYRYAKIDVEYGVKQTFMLTDPDGEVKPKGAPLSGVEALVWG